MMGRDTCHRRTDKRATAIIAAAVALIACSLTLVYRLNLSHVERDRQAGVAPSPYLKTRDQVGHELVKTEQFVVPVGAAIRIEGLEFPSAPCTLTPRQQLILTQVFNSLEEITENTVGDTDAVRVAEFQTMTFEVRGYSAATGHRDQDKANARGCAEVAMDFLTNLGTPAWRLKATGSSKSGPGAKAAPAGKLRAGIRVEFARTK